MTTAVEDPPAAELAGFADSMLNLRPGQRLVLTDVDWAGYEYLLAARAAAGRRGPRLTYCEGVLEAMTTSSLHERLKKTLALLVECWITETGGECIPCGGMTVRRQDRKRGFEPDECYYVQNWRKAAGLRHLDFRTDPPPDLIVEVEVSRDARGRLPVFAGLGVPEVWRYDGDRVTVLLLQSDGSYRESPTSRALPTFPFAELPGYLAMAASVDTSHAAIGRAFRAWVRSLPPAPPA